MQESAERNTNVIGRKVLLVTRVSRSKCIGIFFHAYGDLGVQVFFPSDNRCEITVKESRN